MSKKEVQLKTNLLAIDIGSHSIKIAVGQRNGDKVKITTLVKQELPKGIFDNGHLSDVNALKEILQTLIKENKIKVKDAVLTYESQDIIKREMIVPKVDLADQLELITYEVNQYLPIDINAYVLQYKIIEDIVEENTQKIKILLGAMPRDIVNELFDLLSASGLNPLYLDMHSNSLEKFIEFSFDSVTLNKTIAFVDFGHQVINIVLFEKGVFKFNRLIKLGVGEFDKILSRNLEIPLLEAENRKKKTSLLALQKSNTQENIDETNTKNIVIGEMTSHINDCLDEIDKVFKYYTSRNANNIINQIFLYGGGSQFKEIVPFFKERFEINTEIMNNYNMIEIATKNTVEELPIYVNAVGALIRK